MRQVWCALKLLLCLGLLFAALCAARADEQTRRAQEELRKRNLFFGNVDGRTTPALEAAITRYQERKGFTASGKLTNETLRSLGLAHGPATGTPPASTMWPDVAVLKSDIQRREEAANLSNEKTPPPAIMEKTAETQPDEDWASEKRVREFLEDYLQDAERSDLKIEMDYYTDPLDYFDHGIVGLQFVEADVQSYYKRWPQRKYELVSLQTVPVDDRPELVQAKFRIKFVVKNDEHTIEGQTDNVFTLKATAGKPRIVSMREQRVRP